MNEKLFQIGTPVRLKTGGVAMTIVALFAITDQGEKPVSDENPATYAGCSWWADGRNGERGYYTSDRFPIAALTEITTSIPY